MISEKDFLKEKELLLNSIEQNTKEHWKNYYKDVPIECIYDDLVIDINEIKRLQNNWNELKKWLDEESKLKGSETAYLYYGRVSNKMQEIENRKV